MSSKGTPGFGSSPPPSNWIAMKTKQGLITLHVNRVHAKDFPKGLSRAEAIADLKKRWLNKPSSSFFHASSPPRLGNTLPVMRQDLPSRRLENSKVFPPLFFRSGIEEVDANRGNGMVVRQRHGLGKLKNHPPEWLGASRVSV